MRALCWLVLLAACRQAEPAAPAAPAATTRAPRTGPPRGSIAAIAVADEGDAALTADTLGGLRLWPSLDGTRPPVILPALAATQLALGRSGAGFVAGVIDEAGHVEVIQTTGDGTVIGSAQLASGPGYDDIVAVRDGLLVLGRDQIVARIDARGRELARLVPQPHEHVVELAARRGEAIAGIGVDRAATSVRWLALGDGLAWGAAAALGAPLERLALSPDHRRIAGVVSGQGEGEVIELAPTPHAVASELYIDSPFSTRHEPSTIGFVDDTQVAMAGGFELRWAGTTPNQAVTFGAGVNSAQAVFGDNVAVVGRDDALALVRWHQPVRYLGYHEVGIGAIEPGGPHIAMGLGSGILWFDGRLRVTRVMEEADHDSATSIRPLDDHLAVVAIAAPRALGAGLALDSDALAAARDRAAREPTRFVVRDIERATAHVLGAWPNIESFAFEPRSRVLAIASGRTIVRFAIDERGAGTQLATLALHLEPGTIAPIDPRRAGGIVAVAVAQDGGQMSIETVREAGAATTRIAATRLLGIDHRATVWALHGDHDVVAHRDGARVTQFSVTGPVDEGDVSGDGSFVVLYQWQANELFAVEASGRERWRRPVLQVGTARLMGDDRGVAVDARGRLIALDPFTGELVASGCAWDFGLHDKPSLSNGTQCDEPE